MTESSNFIANQQRSATRGTKVGDLPSLDLLVTQTTFQMRRFAHGIFKSSIRLKERRLGHGLTLIPGVPVEEPRRPSGTVRICPRIPDSNEGAAAELSRVNRRACRTPGLTITGGQYIHGEPSARIQYLEIVDGLFDSIQPRVDPSEPFVAPCVDQFRHPDFP